MDLRAVTFDFFGTLVRHRYGEGRSARFREYLNDNRLAGEWDRTLMSALFEPFQHRWREEQVWIEFTRRLFQLANVEGARAVDEHVESVRGIFGPSAFSVFEEAPGVLADLEAAGFRLALISNWQRGLAYFLQELGLSGHFDAVICSAEVGCEKPDPRIFEMTRDALDVEPARIVHVGDDREADVAGALAAGWRAVLVDRGGGRRDVDVPVVQDLRGLRAVLP